MAKKLAAVTGTNNTQIGTRSLMQTTCAGPHSVSAFLLANRLRAVAQQDQWLPWQTVVAVHPVRIDTSLIRPRLGPLATSQ